ncbi:serine hydrolase [Microbacterium sp. zg-YB36]|uniref:serine hydrolase n=1 Tax=Microbacterium sp. zg-YB36 TaxID=2969407 RepID=UPI00214B37F8|nr:serine hydrolase [Microbacterium sp. zg-YB36]MDL5352811.1 serine hydrolase [Microbacterium sp. zg-YB36]
MNIDFAEVEHQVPGLRFSALAVDLDDDTVVFAHHPDLVLSTASIGKIFLLHRLLTEVDRGERSLEDTVTRRPVEYIEDSGLWYLLQADTLSLYDVAALIGAVSDNAATNTLCRVIGLPVVQEHTRELGYRDSGLDDIVRWPRPAGAPPRLSHATATELVRFVRRTVLAEDLTPASADTLQRWLGAGMDLSMVASGFHLDPLAHYDYDRDVWLWNKTGTNSSVRADIGLVMSPTRRIAYAVVANWTRGADEREPAMDAMRRAGDVMRSRLAEG